MRVTIDRDRCEGHGMCEERADHLFRLDEAGELIFAYEGQDVPADDELDMLAAVRVCPVAALTAAR